MRIEESRTSLVNWLGWLGGKHFPGLVMKDKSHYLVFKLPQRLVDGREDKLKISKRELFPRILDFFPPALFERGEWQKIIVTVYDGNFFAGAVEFAREYEASTGKSVVVVKEF